MPQLPFNGLAESDAMMTGCARAALDFGNGNKINSARPAKELDITGFNDACYMDHHIHQKVSSLIAMCAPVTHVSTITPRSHRYAQKSPPSQGVAAANQGGSGGNGGGTPHGGNSNGSRGGGGKRGADNRDRNGTPTPDPKRNRPNDPPLPNSDDSKEKGFVILKDPSADPALIFPAGLDKRSKPCPWFCSQGLACKYGRGDCIHGNHWFTPKKIPSQELDKIGDHFQANEHAWFNKKTMEKSRDHWWPKPTCTKVLGNRKGVIGA